MARFKELLRRGARHLLVRLSYRRAMRALRKAKARAWYLCDLLERRLKANLITPAEVLAALRSLPRGPQS